jgi:four helix bundle protein
MKSHGFEDLRVYRLAEKLADEVWDMAWKWGAFARNTVGGQLVRSADSVGANIAEGCGRGSYQDNRRFIRMARGSLYETRHWLRRAFRRQLLSESQIKSLKPLIDELGPKLNAYLKSIGPSSTNDK